MFLPTQYIVTDIKIGRNILKLAEDDKICINIYMCKL